MQYFLFTLGPGAFFCKVVTQRKRNMIRLNSGTSFVQRTSSHQNPQISNRQVTQRANCKGFAAPLEAPRIRGWGVCATLIGSEASLLSSATAWRFRLHRLITQLGYGANFGPLFFFWNSEWTALNQF